jgi:hypothetical protein
MLPHEPTCLGFHNIDCGTLTKGILAVVAALVLFIGSVFVLLTAILGRWMAYLVIAVCFSGWMLIFSSVWAFGYWSQGPGTVVNLGPRGALPAWIPLNAGLSASAKQYPTFASYPNGPWANEPSPGLSASVTTVAGAVEAFLAQEANTQLHLDPFGVYAIPTSAFVVTDVRFAPDGKTSLAVAQAYYSGGGPLITVTLYHDSGSVQRYSYMFLFGSLIILLAHIPLLDKAEKKRKDWLTGGSAPAWFGPA